MYRALLFITLLALAACRSTEVSPGREQAIVRYFECEAIGERPVALRALFERHGMRHREQDDRPNTYLAAGVLGTSEFLVQWSYPYARTSLYVQRGVAPTPAERTMLDELAGVFAGCRERPQLIR